MLNAKDTNFQRSILKIINIFGLKLIFYEQAPYIYVLGNRNTSRLGILHKRKAARASSLLLCYFNLVVTSTYITP
jgi:hypothetical protein